MPLGFQRLNERSQRPNPLINFIKPLKSSSPQDQKIAQDFLERIAAQCYPVMKRDHIAVMSLEEYKPNPEFLGRNFNAGEVIQLVLKDRAGRWLSLRFVQMVMMHELAHCKQMNHSKYFWQVRNRYADHMKELWAKKYQGEGVWGRGQDLTTGGFVHDSMPEGPEIPEHLCGGTYGRSRKRKRGKEDAANPKSTYAERQQKRIAKKFGVHGEGHDLGEDELVRGALEQGHRRQGKPRVANSKRGRDLRANAALARFEAEKQDKQRQQTRDNSPMLFDSETESEDDSYNPDPEMDARGGKITGQQDRDLYQVCGDEGEEPEGGQEELAELQQLGVKLSAPTAGGSKNVTFGLSGNKKGMELTEDSETESEPEPSTSKIADSGKQSAEVINEDSETESEPDVPALIIKSKTVTDHAAAGGQSSATIEASCTTPTRTTAARSGPPIANESSATASVSVPPTTKSASCPICTMENDKDSPTCAACAHVIKPSLMPNHWRCKSDSCGDSAYINAGDAGRCGLCGEQKPVANVKKPMGVLSADILRWD